VVSGLHDYIRNKALDHPHDDLDGRLLYKQAGFATVHAKHSQQPDTVLDQEGIRRAQC